MDIFSRPIPDTSVLPVLDREQIASISEGSNTHIRKFSAIFIEITAQSLEELSRLCVEGISEPWVGSAHSLKGSAAMFGAARMHALCAHAQNLRDASSEERKAILDAMRRAFQEVQAALKKEGWI